MGSAFVDAVVRFFYPGACPACLAPSDDDLLCPDCARRVPYAQGHEAPEALEAVPTLVACQYSGVVRDLVLLLKFGRDSHPATALGEILAGVLQSSAFARGADSVVPLPLSARRMRERGFNQAERIAAVVASRLGLPMLTRLLGREVHRPPQAELLLAGRARNVRGVFRAREGAFGRAVLLLDDVITTGHTMAEAAKALEAAGARRVLCVAVAASGWTEPIRNAGGAPGTPSTTSRGGV